MAAGRDARVAMLALVPMAFAVLGAWVDERTHLGFTLWRAACRSAGISLSSLFTFSVELLPGAIAGALLGGLLLQTAAVCSGNRGRSPRPCLAAHGGCAVGMLVAMPLCASLPSTALMLAIEASLAVGLALALCRWPAARARAPVSVGLPTSQPRSA